MLDMEREAGYIKLHRRALSSAIWQNVNDWRLAETILLRANWKPGVFQSRSGEVVKIGRGEMVTSLENLAKASGLSIRNVRTSLEHLEKAEFLTSESTNHFRIVSILNYEKYQEIDKQSDKDLTSTRQRYNKGNKEKITDTFALQATDPPNNLNGHENGNGVPDLVEEKPFKASPPNSAPPPSPFGPDELMELWNREAAPTGLPKAEKMTADRRNRALARLKEEPNADHWKRVMEGVQVSAFLHGENARKWKASFDFLLERGKAIKIVEGQYGNGWKGVNLNGSEHLFA